MNSSSQKILLSKLVLLIENVIESAVEYTDGGIYSYKGSIYTNYRSFMELLNEYEELKKEVDNT